VVSGIVVTESGILAHLGGAGSVKRYFNNGEKYIKDAYGTSIRSYMEAFEDMILHQ
jgi:hypothetical protein